MKKKILLTSLAFLAGAAISGGVVYIIKTNEIQQLDQQITKLTEESKPTSSNDPDNSSVLSPYNVALKPNQYTDKVIEVSGFIQQTPQSTYILMSREPEEPIGLALDFSQSNINPDNYAAKAVTSKESNPDTTNVQKKVTIKGTLKEHKKDNLLSYSLEVESLD